MSKKRISVLLNGMAVIEMYTLDRALRELRQSEFEWEPHPGAWGVRRRTECTTANPVGVAGSEWVLDHDWDLAGRDDVVEPMPTIGWLLNHIGAAPGLTADFDFLGGSTVPSDAAYQRMWGQTVLPTVDDAVARLRDGWADLRAAVKATTDEDLERDAPGHPWKRGDRAVSALLNEVSHHGTQICVLRDLIVHRPT